MSTATNLLSSDHLILIRVGDWILKNSVAHTRHTDKSRSPAPDIAVPRQALCYLSWSNRSLKNRSLFTSSAFLSPSKYTAFKTKSALNKHCISKNHWTAIASSLSFGAEQSGNYGVYYCKIHTC